VLLLALPVFIILKNSKPGSRAASSAQSFEPVTPAEGKPKSDGALEADGLLHGQQVDRREPARGKDSPSDYNGSLPAGSPAPAPVQPGDAFTGNIAMAREGAPAVPGSASEPAPQKTEAGEAGKPSDSAQLAQNNPQPSRQQDNEQQNNQAKSKVEVTSAAGQLEKQQSPAPPSQVAADKYDAAKKVEQSASSEQISSKQAQTLPEDDKKTGVNTLRQGAVGPENARAKEVHQTIRPKDSEPPRSESAGEEKERGIAKGPARDFSRSAGRRDVDSVHKPATQPLVRGQKLERRVDTKRFRMQAGVWTDRDFKPAKEIPAVTLVRDTEVYKSTVEKQPGLKAFLAGFGSDERVIVVYKGIVYKIQPSTK